MWPYFLCMIFSCSFAWLDAAGTHGNKKRWNICGLIAVVLPCILAALRDVNVGTDTRGYGTNLFQIAVSNNFFDFYNHNNTYVINTESLYRIFVYTISIFVDNVCWQFFFIEFICIAFIYKGLKEAELGNRLWIGMFLFHMLFYSYSLNLMRQIIAMAILFWAFKYVLEKKLVTYIITTVIASLFHSVAVVGLIVYPLYIICTGDLYQRGKNAHLKKFLTRYRQLINVGIIGASCAIVFFAGKLIEVLAVIKGSYGYQLVHMNDTYNFSVGIFGLMILFLAPLIYFHKQLVSHNKIYNFYTMCLVIATIVWQVCGISRESYRVVLYLWIFVLRAVPEMIRDIRSRNKRVLLTSYYIILGFVYYICVFIVFEFNATYPYTSSILGIK